MDRGIWQATVHGVQRVRHNQSDLVHIHIIIQKGLIWLIRQIQIQLIEKNLHIFYKSDSFSNGHETLESV